MVDQTIGMTIIKCPTCSMKGHTTILVSCNPSGRLGAALQDIGRTTGTCRCTNYVHLSLFKILWRSLLITIQIDNFECRIQSMKDVPLCLLISQGPKCAPRIGKCAVTGLRK